MIRSIIMKEKIFVVIAFSTFLFWNEYRYRNIDSRLNTIEQSKSISKEINSNNKEPFVSSKDTHAYTKKPKKSYTSPKNETSPQNVQKNIQPVEPYVALDLKNPEIQEELHRFLEEREKEKKEVQRAQGLGEYLDYVEKNIEKYAQEHGVSSSVSQAVMIEIQTRTNEYVSVEYAAEDGELDWSEAKPEMERIKQEGKNNLIDILGEEEYQVFERVVWGGGSK